MSAPVRLNDKNTGDSISDRLDAWAMAHARLILTPCLIILILLGIVVCYKLLGIGTLESSMMRNFINGGYLSVLSMGV